MRPFIRTRFQTITRNALAQHRQYSTAKPTTNSTHTVKTATNTSSNPTVTTQSRLPSSKRIDRILNRTPKFLHKYLQTLRSAPVSHITSFLLLHELTAVIPLFGLVATFHYYNWLPAYFAEGAWVLGGVEKFGRYFKRKGWISDADEKEVEEEAKRGEDLRDVESSGKGGRSGRAWDKGEGGVRLVVEFATAYALVKALLVPRLVFSAWAAPAFARWTLIPVMSAIQRSRAARAFRNRFRRKTAGPQSGI